MDVNFVLTDEQINEIREKNKKYTIVFDGNRIRSICKVYVGLVFSREEECIRVVEGFTYDSKFHTFTVWFSRNNHKHLSMRLSSILRELKGKKAA
jgi:hypothetical protein